MYFKRKQLIRTQPREKWPLVLLSLALPLVVGGVAGAVTAQNVREWYPQLNKPFFTPPNALFAPVWTALYLLMGISLYLVLRQAPTTARKNAVILFGVQLFFNFWWSIIFFQFHLIGLALIDIVLLWSSIIWMISLIYKVSRRAANLQWPYLAWVSFATALNASVWYLN
ncbi:tryptophan-rich sensory protein [Paraflavitalea soli]|uniref:Tryptophan-rich sensory protein n=2 Tax=Paraflavitalea soli TaxID=2315862 RepID=A0A3B7MZR0_9BACT|nr:tryptophan-rich sensory protein [Paraflavitalea soli]